VIGGQRIEAYWLPGCSSCLRMKEFLEKAGRAFHAINLQESLEGQAKLARLGVIAPAACVGDICVSGLDLAAVAALVGVDYEPRPMLSPAALIDRYNMNLDAGRRYIRQMSDDMLAYSLGNRDRPMISVAYQVAMLGRSFLAAYNEDRHDIQYYMKPDDITSRDQILRLAEETRRLMNQWWAEDGEDDPLDRVTQTYWGYPTLHEVFEREVWHTTQHVRQLMDILQRFGVSPDGPLTHANLVDLPLPERIHE